MEATYIHDQKQVQMSQSQHYTTAAEDRIPFFQKSAYAVGMFVNNLQAAALPAMVVILNLGLGGLRSWLGLGLAQILP